MRINIFGNSSQKGITVAEVLTVIFIFGIGISSLFSLFSLGLKNMSIVEQATKATFLAQEAIDATRAFRDNTTWDTDGLGALLLDTSYHPVVQGASSQWQLISGEETMGQFTRKIVFGPAQRDLSGNIVSSGGSIDQNTKKVVVSVRWQERGAAKNIELTTYLGNWR